MVDIHPSGKIQFDLVSPVKIITSAQVDMIVAPGEEGLFGVLIGHTPLIALLKPGVIDIYDNNQISNRIFIAGGFAEVNGDGCVILAEEAEPLDRLDRAAITQQIQNLETSPKAQDEAINIDLTSRTELAIARAKIAALDSKPL